MNGKNLFMKEEEINVNVHTVKKKIKKIFNI